ncbi:MAG: formylglycine-generating enzyme family protein [Clostridia bacterium]|nr:formylglycine-generating enzyme family protein [Clostridia bacterium]
MSGSNVGATDGFKNAKTLTTNSGTGSYVLLTTGSTEEVKRMNLYDVAGNLWEWTTEAAYHKDSTYAGNINYNTYTLRGGGLDYAYATHPVAYRAGLYAPNTSTSVGFRPALFLQ